jgi:uncharacterized membrane protein YeaQ/YmgE (transglycosylase-associated protein family)
MGLLWTILIGFLIGAVAKLIMPGKDPGGFIVTTLLGIAGSVVGSWLVRLLGLGHSVGFIGAVIGALILLGLYRGIKKP